MKKVKCSQCGYATNSVYVITHNKHYKLDVVYCVRCKKLITK